MMAVRTTRQQTTSVLSPALLLKLEGASALALSLVLYARNGESWWLFALIVLAPDLSMVGYLKDNATGARTYNLIHTYTLPIVLVGVGLFTSPLVLSLALIWIAHIGMDRMLGFGLKYETAFKDTHLGHV